MMNSYERATMNKSLVFSLVFLGAAIFSAANAWADVTVYRGVDANSNNGYATLSPSQFSFTGSPATLSTFDDPTRAPVQKKCNYAFTINIHNPPQVGDSGSVVFNNPPPPVYAYTATFDDNPPGHWSINLPQGVNADVAKQDISAYAQAHREAVVNGKLDNCK